MFFCLIIFYPLAAVINLILAEDWLHHTVLDSNDTYHLYWTPKEYEIFFKVEVKAKGYAGLGLSPNGGMAGSDIVTGWVKDGKVFFQDRYAEGREPLKLDRQQDWELVEGSENDTHTSLVFRRYLVTCDENDMEIDESTMRVIYAYSDEDPENDAPQYHHEKKGVKSVLLLQKKIEEPKHIDTSQLLQWDVLSPNFTLTGDKSTVYWCKIHKSPELLKEHHIIRAEPLITPGHEQYVHHLLMYECVGGTGEDYEDLTEEYGHQCRHPNMPDAMWRCDGVFLAWGVGGNAIIMPEDAGIPLDPMPSKYYMLEIHYDNPTKQAGIVDQSGFRIYYTPNLRKYKAGSLMIGSTISPRLFVPPRREKYVIAGHSNSDCLAPAMPEDGVKVIAVLLHSHLLGRRIITRHFRNDTELPPIAADLNYDFNYQDYRYLPEELRILPEDQITVECTYDSTERNITTFGGESTREEMCLAFLLHYPRIEIFGSLSGPEWKTINKALETNFTQAAYLDGRLQKELIDYDWSNVNVSTVENSMRYSKHMTYCYLGNGTKHSVKSLISYPSPLQEYKIEKCDLIIDTFSRSSQSGYLIPFYSIISLVIVYISTKSIS